MFYFSPFWWLLQLSVGRSVALRNLSILRSHPSIHLCTQLRDQSRSQNTGILKSTLQSMSIYWESLSNHGRCIESRYRQNPGFALFIRSVLPWGLLRVCSKFALLIQSRPEQTQRTRSSAGVRFMLGCVWSEWYRIPRLSFWGSKVKGQGSY